MDRDEFLKRWSKLGLEMANSGDDLDVRVFRSDSYEEPRKITGYKNVYRKVGDYINAEIEEHYKEFGRSDYKIVEMRRFDTLEKAKEFAIARRKELLADQETKNRMDTLRRFHASRSNCH